tara:strand:+ start:1240 stop:2277 length:1038 start_codon:yes stop_codon:yes gene_type:complete
MTIAASNIRNLIPFAGGNWDALVNNPIFSALVAEAPEFWGLSEGEFKILDFIDENVICDPDDENANTARAGGTRCKKKDFHLGYDPTQRPLIVVRHKGKYYLWDGFNRWIELSDLGETSAPIWLYELLDGYDFDEVKEHVQLSANNHAKSDEATRRDFINCGVRWAERNNIDDLEDIKTWVNRSEHQWKSKEVDKIASSILVESEVANVRHISTGSAAKSEAYEFLDLELKYGEERITNPIVLCTKEDDYIKDAFMTHMRKFVQDKDDLETTELVGYTKGCESEEAVIKQREDAKERFQQLDDLVCDYAFKKMKLNGKMPYEWKGFLPQLFGKECGDGIAKKLVD